MCFYNAVLQLSGKIFQKHFICSISAIEMSAHCKSNMFKRRLSVQLVGRLLIPEPLEPIRQRIAQYVY